MRLMTTHNNSFLPQNIGHIVNRPIAISCFNIPNIPMPGKHLL